MPATHCRTEKMVSSGPWQGKDAEEPWYAVEGKFTKLEEYNPHLFKLARKPTRTMDYQPENEVSTALSFENL